MPIGIRVIPRPGFVVMLCAAALGGLLEWITPRVVPPGNVWERSDTLALVIILAGAAMAGWMGLRYAVAILGAAAATCFTLWLPDSRDNIAIGRGYGSFDSYLLRYCLFILATSLGCTGCAILGGYARRYVESRRHPSRLNCPACGYDLRGLPERRCPECGKPFAWEPPTPTDSE
jgi:hypothetical protein